MNPKTPLRELMLDTHEVEVKKLFELPKLSNLHYNHESTQICVDGIPIYKYLQKKLFDNGFVSYLGQIRTQRRDKITQAHSTPSEFSSDEFFHRQFDYELLAIDHLVDTDLANKIADNLDSEIDRHYVRNVFLTPSTGRTFFEEVHLKELESLGHQLLRQNGHTSEKDFFFEGKGFQHFLKHTMTRDKLIRIILDYDSVERRLQERYDSLPSNNNQFKTPSDVYEHLKETRIEQMRRRGTWNLLSSKLSPKEQTYIRFVGNALDFNEDNRLLRSISFYHAMQDKTLEERFYELIEMRKNGYR